MIQNIQLLRALAAYMVVCAHLGGLLRPLGITDAAFENGTFGVDIFFVISGFIMVVTTAQRSVTPGSFMLNRIVRIVPLYWLLTLLVFALAQIAPTLLDSTAGRPVNLLRSLFFIPYERFDGTIRPMLFLGWTLNYEMFFYALFAASLLLRDAAVRVALISLALVGIVALGVLMQPDSVLLRFYTRPIVIEFALGMLVGLAYVRFAGQRGAVMLAIATACGVVALACAFSDLPLRRAWVSAGAATAIVAAALALEAQGRRLGGSFGVLMGNASYSLYLVHPFAIQAVAKVAELASVERIAASLAMTALALLAATLAGVACHVLVEKPLTRRVRDWLGSPRPRLRAGAI